MKLKITICIGYRVIVHLRVHMVILFYELSFLYSITSFTLQSSISQNIFMVLVLTLSFLFSLVNCPGLTWYFLISAYLVMPFSFIVIQRLSYVIISTLQLLCLACIGSMSFVLHINRFWYIIILTNIGYVLGRKGFRMNSFR